MDRMTNAPDMQNTTAPAAVGVPPVATSAMGPSLATLAVVDAKPATTPPVPPLVITLVKSKSNAVDLERREFSTAEEFLQSFLTYPRRVGEKDGPAFVPASFPAGGRRRAADVTSMSAMILDLDGADPNDPDGYLPFDLEEILARLPWRCVVYTTFSHTLERPKIRVVFPLAAAITPQQHRKLWHWVNGRIDRVMDQACKDSPRLYFFPRRPADVPDSAHFTRDYPGAFLSIQDLPADYELDDGDRHGDAGGEQPLAGTAKPKQGMHLGPPSRFQMAVDRFNSDHRRSYPRSGSGTCPICGHKGCFGRLKDTDRWSCFSASHTEVGRQGDVSWSGDALDLDAHEEGLTRAELLEREGYLGGEAELEDEEADEDVVPDFSVPLNSSPAAMTTAHPMASVAPLSTLAVGAAPTSLAQTGMPASPPPPAAAAAASAARQPRGAVRIVLGTDEHRVTDEAIKALSTDRETYQRGGQLVRATREATVAKNPLYPAGAPRVQALPKPSIRERLTVFAQFGSRTFAGGKPKFTKKHPPTWTVEQVAARGSWDSIRVLAGIVDTPVLRMDGSILDKPGYDAATGLLYEPRATFPAIPANPTLADALLARDELLEVVVDFPFEEPVHEAAWLAAALTPFARFAYSGPTPMFVVIANVRAAGKGMAVWAIGEIALGHPMSGMPMADSDEEMRKQITRIALSSARMVNIDNIVGSLGSASLDRALTETHWSDRLLGGNQSYDGPLTAIWFATGNNVQFVGDTLRRCLPIRLESPEEKPERRNDFKHPDLKAWVTQNRDRLAVAALTILRAYFAASTPKSDIKAWGSYEGWSDLVRQALVWLGEQDPIDACEKQFAISDLESNALRELLDGWIELDPAGAGVTVRDALQSLEPVWDGGQSRRVPMGSASLHSALSELFPNIPQGHLPSAGKLGKKLAHFRGRRCDGKMLCEVGEAGGSKLWAVRGPKGEVLHRNDGPSAEEKKADTEGDPKAGAGTSDNGEFGA